MDKTVTVHDIHWIVCKFLECSEVVETRDRLSGGLGIDLGVLADIKRTVHFHGDGSYSYFSKILSQWINNEAERATIGNLISILQNEKFNKTAVDIQKEWKTSISRYGSGSSNRSSSLYLKRNTEVWNIPARNLNFVGRSKILNDIEKYFSGEADHTLIGIICGLGGVGNSSVALKFAWTRRFKYTHVYWFNSDQRVQLLNDYIALALKVGIISDSVISKLELELDHIGRKLKSWLEQSENHGWLAIYDNAPTYNDIFDLLPVIGGNILLTSRFQIWCDGMIFSTNKFSHSETSEYIRNTLGQSTPPGHIDLLAMTFDYFPLALAQACAYIKHSSITIPKYLALYNKNKEKWLKTNVRPRQIYTTCVFITWEITIKKIEEQSHFAARWLKILSVFHSDNVSHILLKTFLKWNGSDKDEYVEILLTLASFSMIQVNKYNEFTSMHRLLQEVIMLKMNHEERGKIVCIAFFLVASKAQKTKISRSRSTLNWIHHWKALLSSVKLLAGNQITRLRLSSTDLIPPNPNFVEIEVETSFLHSILTLLAKSEAGNFKIIDATEQANLRKLIDILKLFFGKNSLVVADWLQKLSFALNNSDDVLDQAMEIYIANVYCTCQSPEDRLFWLMRKKGEQCFFEYADYKQGIQEFISAFELHEQIYKPSDINLWRIHHVFSPLANSVAKRVPELSRIFLNSIQGHTSLKSAIVLLYICIQEDVNEIEKSVLSRILANIPADKKDQVCKLISTQMSDHWKITVLSFACLFRRTNAVKTLIEFGIDPTFKNSMGQSSLHYFPNEVLKLDDRKGKSAFCLLMDEILSGYQKHTRNFQLTSILDAINHKGYSPLRCVAKNGNIGELTILLTKATKYIDINRRDLKGETPVMIAIRNGRIEVAKILFKHGASATILSQRDTSTILHQAVASGNSEILILVIQKIRHECTFHQTVNDWLNATDSEGDTPLVWAAEKAQITQTEILLQNGVDINIKNNKGETALDCAVKNKNIEVATLLRKYGAGSVH